MDNVSGSELILNARRRANLQGAASFIPDAEALEYANKSIAAWYDLVRLTTFGGQMYRKTAVINLQQNKSVYGIADGFPSDLLSLLSVDGFVTTGSSPIVISIMSFQEEQRNMYRWYPSVGITQSPVFCQLQGDAIAFLPVPFSGAQVGLNYVPTYPKLGKLSDVLNVWSGYDEWIVISVAIKMLVKSGLRGMLPDLKEDLAKETDRIRSAIGDRNNMAAETVHDVEGYGGRGSGWPWGF